MNNFITNTYFLNQERIIVSVGNNWDRFAHENGGEILTGDYVIGTSVWDYIKGDTTRMWFDTLLQFVSLRKELVERPYRCDSPGIKRFMNLRVSCEDSGLIKLDHIILKTEIQEKPVFFQYTSEIVNNVKFRCSICGRVSSKGRWHDAASQLFDDWDGKVFYTVCDSCKTLLPHI